MVILISIMRSMTPSTDIIDMSPKISVLVICYNQEGVIARALDSIIRQKEYVRNIFIFDDHSTDKTVSVIKSYSLSYPDLITLEESPKNLGIFLNIERKWQFTEGELIYDLSGDDEVPDGWFKKVTEFIISNQINYKNKKVTIFGNSKCIYPDGDEITFKNKSVQSIPNLLKLYQRGLINNRGCVYSIEIMKQFINVSKGRSYVAENAQDSQLHIFTEKAFYINALANIYYTNIGVSSRMSIETVLEHEKTMEYAFDFFDSIGINYDQKDFRLIAFNKARKRFLRKKTVSNLTNVVIKYLKAFDHSIFLKDLRLKKLFFTFFRKIPFRPKMRW